MPYNVPCTHCGKPHYKRPSGIKRAGGKSFCSKECAGLYTRVKYPHGDLTCSQCGKLFRSNPAYVTRRPKQKKWFCGRGCFNLHLARNKGKELKMAGTPYSATSGSKKRYHRHVMENHLGRELRADEHVHHKDGNKKNNDISNLEVLAMVEHMRLHQEAYIKKTFYKYEYLGEMYCISTLAKKAGLTSRCVSGRLARGWSVKKTVETPNGANYTGRKNPTT